MHANRAGINKTVEICMKRLFLHIPVHHKHRHYLWGKVLSLSNTATHSPRWPSQLGDDDLVVTSGETMCDYNDCQVLQIRETSLQILSTLLGRMNNASQTGL